ncbi:MAG TPA: 4-demethylwyosine synthase TYW1 [Candidatus Diapherotrites archaeon]|uniref:S-adenosyl-L-methionine-dependent tRNA 4-demethylwyosine synthase n=1 Tax=Candidatus Iainarchaeum sp. TaxID=3101447 RepID=A0A7J4JH07_9ARCH|nr:4-demethylwyosine synthase TYW1 [Candidatus Diapherotrites archaeon]HIH17031.1 4-demethylwyosine synthase TYW1 [Candidatus Diapherotrites archaeon]
MREPEDYMPKAKTALLRNKQYALFGHSAVKVCHWTKKSLTEGKSCYKGKFYGINSHQCVQMTPSVGWCQSACTFCWRPLYFDPNGLKEDFLDAPEEIVEQSIQAHFKQLSGFGAQVGTVISKEKWAEAHKPRHVAISLSGEPTLYPKIAELISAYRKQGISTFLVTNGLKPEALQFMADTNQLPTQLYVSFQTPTEQMQKDINRSREKDAWKKLNQTFELFPRLKTRKVVRVTLLKGINDAENLIQGFADMIGKGKPDFVEVKSYMHIGQSRQRLGRHNMCSHEEIKAWSQKLAKALGYQYADDSPESLVALLWNGTTPRFIDFSNQAV